MDFPIGVLRRAAMVVLQHAAVPLTADDLAIRLADVVGGSDELIVEPLMVSFSVIMLDPRKNGFSQHRLAEEDHLVEAFFLDRANEALGVGIHRRPHTKPSPAVLGDQVVCDSPLVGANGISLGPSSPYCARMLSASQT